MGYSTKNSTAIVHTAVIRGVEALPIEVEVAVSDGLPGFSIVGMADVSVQESRERVKAALRSSGFAMPSQRVVVNLTPSALRKTGSQFDLPIAAAILCATGQIDPTLVENALLVGELSLAGNVLPTRGGLVYALCAENTGRRLICAPQDGGASHAENVAQFRISNLSDLRKPNLASPEPYATKCCSKHVDFDDIPGYEVAKRALQIAAAGGHGALLVGAPHSGAAALAAYVASILPPLTKAEALEAAVAHSAAGEPIEAILNGARPFRSPHHSTSLAGLLGGGIACVMPGEAALAHNGVLFLDELQDFSSSALQILRQPAESGEIVITRVNGSIRFPARFLLVAAAQPCSCGYYGAEGETCTCRPNNLRLYSDRLGGPLRSLFALSATVTSSRPGDAIECLHSYTAEGLRGGVLRGREYAAWRRAKTGEEPNQTNNEIVVNSCALSDEARDHLEEVAVNLRMSGPAISRTLAVARTIADIEQKEQIGLDDVREAIYLRGIL